MTRSHKQSLGDIKRGAKLSYEITGIDSEGRGRANLRLSDGDVDLAIRGAFDGHGRGIVERIWDERRLIQMRPAHDKASLEQTHAANPVSPFEGASPSLEYAFKESQVREMLIESMCSGENDGLWQDTSKDVELENIWVSNKAEGSRQKVRFAIQHQNSRLRIGYYIPHTKHFRAEHSLSKYNHPELNQAANALEHFHLPQETVGELVSAELRIFKEGVSLQLTRSNDNVPPLCHEALHRLSEKLSLAHLSLSTLGTNPNIKTYLQPDFVVGAEKLHEIVSGREVSVYAFCQADPWLAAQMYDYVAGEIKGLGAERVLDAFAGSGGFSQALKAQNIHVHALERHGSANEDLGNVADEISVGDAYTTISQVLEAGFDVALFDPPRRGLMHIAQHLGESTLRHVVLVSCALKAASRDYAALKKAGFALRKVQPFDLFPGTTSIEVVSFWSRED